MCRSSIWDCGPGASPVSALLLELARDEVFMTMKVNPACVLYAF